MRGQWGPIACIWALPTPPPNPFFFQCRETVPSSSGLQYFSSTILNPSFNTGSWVSQCDVPRSGVEHTYKGTDLNFRAPSVFHKWFCDVAECETQLVRLCLDSALQSVSHLGYAIGRESRAKSRLALSEWCSGASLRAVQKWCSLSMRSRVVPGSSIDPRET